MILKGVFNITDWQETTLTDFGDGRKLNSASIKQSYSGDIVGESAVNYLMSYQSTGDAHFNGFEYLDCVIADQKHQLVLKHQGTFTQGKARSEYTVIESSDEQLLGKSGTFESGDNGTANYEFNN